MKIMQCQQCQIFKVALYIHISHKLMQVYLFLFRSPGGLVPPTDAILTAQNTDMHLSFSREYTLQWER